MILPLRAKKQVPSLVTRSGRDHTSTHSTHYVDPARLIFVGGLHRSGTSPLGRILADHRDISGFRDTGVEEDEGQHLQDTYAPAYRYGGPGSFARAPAAHLVAVPGSPGSARQSLLESWTPHWDLTRHYLVEKSPPNLIRSRYLQQVFPGSAFIAVLRHPVIVALSTMKWARFQPLERLVEHWFIAHDLLRQDASHLERLHVLHYESMATEAEPCLTGVAQFLGLATPLDASMWQSSRSSAYLDRWRAMGSGSALQRWQRDRIVRRFADRASVYGYDIADPSALPAEHSLG